MTAAIAAAVVVIVFWLGFGTGRATRTPRGRRHAAPLRENPAPAGTSGRPGPVEAATEAHSAAEPPTVVSSATLDQWADRWHGAPVEDVQLPPLPDVTAAARPPGPPPRNVVWQPPAAAAPVIVGPPTAATVAGWYWHEYVRTERELWGPGGIDGPWDPGSVAARASAVLDQMTPVAAAAAPALAAIAAAGMAAL